MKRRASILVLCLAAVALFFSLAITPAARKTAPEGIRWERFHDGGFQESDRPKSMVAGRYKTTISEADKLIFVLGESYNSSDWDVTLRAVHPEEGETAWSRHFNHISSATNRSRPDDRAFMLCLNDDHVFALGSETTGDLKSVVGFAGGRTIGFLYKLDKKTGKEEWKKPLDPGSPTESVVNGKVSLVENGDLLVALTVYDINTAEYDCRLSRVDGSTGEVIWEERVPHGRLSPYEILLSRLGDEWLLTGSADEQGNYPRTFVQRFDPGSGKVIWTYRFSQEGSFNNFPKSVIALDQHLYLLHSGEAGVLVTKIDEKGTEVWTSRFDSGSRESDMPVALLADDRGDLYACLTCRESWHSPAGISVGAVKISAEDGKEIWRTLTSISKAAGEGSILAFAHQIGAAKMLFNSNQDLEVFGTSWNGDNLDLFRLVIDREDGRPGELRHYDGPAQDHDVLTGVALPYQQYGFVGAGTTSRCRKFHKPAKGLWYRLSGGANWAARQRERNSFDDKDPYNYDLVLVRF